MYFGLKSNDLPLYEILRNQKLLKEMLAIPEYAAFWREGINIPLKTHLSLEQSTMRQRRLYYYNRRNQRR